jgi:hypothetical protein
MLTSLKSVKVQVSFLCLWVVFLEITTYFQYT